MTPNLIEESIHAQSTQQLDSLYGQRLIPPEKKPFLIDANQCVGPYLKVQGGGYILDLASQIASSGLGFNPSAQFGAAQYLESWLGHTDSDSVKEVRSAFVDLLRSKAGSQDYSVTFCNSGAEAIECGLVACFEKFGGQRKKILAFEKSFHGRMLVALSCTHNPEKRVPFTWPQMETSFVPYPELEGDDLNCESASEQEAQTLEQIQSLLKSNEYFAVLLEPIQCEGGDRYSSAKFHQRLLALCQNYDVPLVYDEIQSGLGLGGEFFWHLMFGLDSFPDVIVSAKKAQVGFAMSRLPVTGQPEVNFASLSRGYIQSAMMDQFQSGIEQTELLVRGHLNKLVEEFASKISRPRAKGLCFAFDFAEKSDCDQFIAKRFEHGLLYYPAGVQTARFRLNLSFRPADVEFAFSRIRAVLAEVISGETSTLPPAKIQPRNFAESFSVKLIESKLSNNAQQSITAESFLREALADAGYGDLRIEFPTGDSIAELREKLIAIQQQVYEPTRQSPIEEFERVLTAQKQVSIVLFEGDEIAAMAFAAPVKLFPELNGNLQNPQVDDPNAFYMLDLTIAEKYRGGLGRIMKQALVLLAQHRGVTEIYGRNRDRLARGMWAINLSLGSHTTQFLQHEYDDDEEHGDCFYYRCSTGWENASESSRNPVESPLERQYLDSEFVRRNIGVMVNKLTHSNFITADMADDLSRVFKIFGQPLRHGYTASGLSEAVDKLVKVLWLKRKPGTRLLVARDSYWGQGGFMTRSLSSIGTPYFDVEFFDSADQLGQMLNHQDAGEVFGVFVEPTSMIDLTIKCQPNELAEIRTHCSRVNIPLIYNETGSLFHRYSTGNFSVSHDDEVCPDGSIAFLGGQMAVVGVREEYYADQPLMLISTWDGDAFSLARFVEAAKKSSPEIFE